MQQPWPQLPRAIPTTCFVSPSSLSLVCLILEGWQREGVSESLCFAVAVATVVSLVAGAHVSYSQKECEPLDCKNIIFFPC